MRRRSRTFVVISLVGSLLYAASAIAPAPASAASNCLELGNQDIELGDVTDADWDEWTNSQLDFASNERFLQVQQTDAGAVLRQQFVPSSKGSERVTVKGDLAPAPSYRMTQRVFFEPGFDWGRDKQGGKLGFGLGGGTSPTGGDIDVNGFSARFMWRGNGDGTARIVVYSYAADRNQNLPYGDDYPLSDFSAPIGEWFSLTMEVTANSAAGVADGSVRAWANGELALERNGILWQDAGVPQVDRFIYASFYGGNSWDWAPTQTTYVQFNDVCWDTASTDPEPPPPPPSVDGLRERVRVVEADIAGLLPTASGQVNWRLNYALERIARASDEAEWSGPDELDRDSEALRDLQRGIGKLLSAAESSGATEVVRSASLGAADELAAVTATIGRNAVDAAARELSQTDCSCSSARRQLARSQTELAEMATASDATEAATRARRAWSRAQLALDAIP